MRFFFFTWFPYKMINQRRRRHTAKALDEAACFKKTQSHKFCTDSKEWRLCRNTAVAWTIRKLIFNSTIIWMKAPTTAQRCEKTNNKKKPPRSTWPIGRPNSVLLLLLLFLLFFGESWKHHIHCPNWAFRSHHALKQSKWCSKKNFIWLKFVVVVVSYSVAPSCLWNVEK